MNKKYRITEYFSTFAMVALAAVMLGSLSACVKNKQVVGYTFDPLKVKDLRPGVTSKDDTIVLLGSPSSLSNYGDETWYYINFETERAAFFSPEVVDQKILAITFDTNNIITDLGTYTEKDQQPVIFSEEVTPTHGNSFTVLQQLLGNVGRFNPEGKATADPE